MNLNQKLALFSGIATLAACVLAIAAPTLSAPAQAGPLWHAVAESGDTWQEIRYSLPLADCLAALDSMNDSADSSQILYCERADSP